MEILRARAKQNAQQFNKSVIDKQHDPEWME
jgi:hypothetical protein